MRWTRGCVGVRERVGIHGPPAQAPDRSPSWRRRAPPPASSTLRFGCSPSCVCRLPLVWALACRRPVGPPSPFRACNSSVRGSSAWKRRHSGWRSASRCRSAREKLPGRGGMGGEHGGERVMEVLGVGSGKGLRKTRAHVRPLGDVRERALGRLGGEADRGGDLREERGGGGGGEEVDESSSPARRWRAASRRPRTSP